MGTGENQTYVINCDKSAVRPADFSASILEPLKGLLWNVRPLRKYYPEQADGLE